MQEFKQVGEIRSLVDVLERDRTIARISMVAAEIAQLELSNAGEKVIKDARAYFDRLSEILFNINLGISQIRYEFQEKGNSNRHGRPDARAGREV